VFDAHGIGCNDGTTCQAVIGTQGNRSTDVHRTVTNQTTCTGDLIAGSRNGYIGFTQVDFTHNSDGIVGRIGVGNFNSITGLVRHGSTTSYAEVVCHIAPVVVD